MGTDDWREWQRSAAVFLSNWCARLSHDEGVRVEKPDPEADLSDESEDGDDEPEQTGIKHGALKEDTAVEDGAAISLQIPCCVLGRYPDWLGESEAAGMYQPPPPPSLLSSPDKRARD